MTRVAWNKGLVGVTKYPNRKKSSIPPWNKGIIGIIKYPKRKMISDDDRKKLSEAQKKRGTVPPSRKNAPPNKTSFKKGHGLGVKKIITDTWRENISKGLKGNIPWNKGKGDRTATHKRIRNSIEYRQWREAVFSRDNYTCRNCLIRGRRGLGRPVILNPHHIKSFAKYPDLRFDVSNGLTLCIDCHRSIHSKTKTTT